MDKMIDEQTGITTKHKNESFESVFMYVLLLYAIAGLVTLACVIVSFLLLYLCG